MSNRNRNRDEKATCTVQRSASTIYNLIGKQTQK